MLDLDSLWVVVEGFAAVSAIIWLTQLLSLAVLSRRTRPMTMDELDILQRYITLNPTGGDHESHKQTETDQ